MSETVNGVIGLRIKKFDLTCGRLILETDGKVQVRMPEVSVMRQIWLECGGSGAVFHVVRMDKNRVGSSFELEVSELTSPTVRNDFCKFLARRCHAV